MVGAAIAENHLGKIRIVEYVHDIADKCLQSGDGIRTLMREEKRMETTVAHQRFAHLIS
jgi:hypothetical protein